MKNASANHFRFQRFNTDQFRSLTTLHPIHSRLMAHLLVHLAHDSGEVHFVPVALAADKLQLSLHLHEAHLISTAGRRIRRRFVEQMA